MNRILVPGGTGFIGRHLVRALVARGDAVTVLSRRRDRGRGESGVNFEVWDPHHRGDWFSLMQEHQAVAHLVGEQAVGRRYTTAVMHRIVESRVESTRLLVQALAAAEPRPKVLVCASAIGYYGPRPADEALDERAAPGSDFLAELTQKWEAAANEALKFGVRVVNARFGIILGAGGGALPEMARPFRMFLGGPIGSGKQVISWVHVDDAVAALLLAIDDGRISGAVNVTAPNPVTNQELSQHIGRVLGRPSWLRVPGFALKALFGAGAEPLLGGQRLVPKVLQDLGFAWRFPEIGPALEQALR